MQNKSNPIFWSLTGCGAQGVFNKHLWTPKYEFTAQRLGSNPLLSLDGTEEEETGLNGGGKICVRNRFRLDTLLSRQKKIVAFSLKVFEEEGRN